MNITSRNAIREYLTEVKQTITNQSVPYETWVIVPRDKNLDCMASLGLTSLDVYTTILGLSVSDYCEGPAKDYAEKGDCWVFGTVINGCEIYIKLKIAAISIIKKVRIISFHIADKALCYPCRQTEGDKEGQKNGEENN